MIKLLKKFKRRTPLGWLQLTRTKNRLLVALSGIIFADVLMFMQLGFELALYDSNTRLHKNLDADIVLVNPQASYLARLYTFPRRRLYQSKDIPGVISISEIYIFVSNIKHERTKQKGNVVVIGINPYKSPITIPDLNQNISSIKKINSILLDRNSKGDYQTTVAQLIKGQKVITQLNDKNIKIENIFTLGASFVANVNVITSIDTFLLLYPDRTIHNPNLGLIKVKSGYHIPSIVSSLKKRLPSDVQVLTHQEFIQLEENYWKKNSPIGFIFRVGLIMAFSTGMILLYQVLANGFNFYLPEYGLLKAMGYRPVYFLSIIFEEAIILCVLGFIPSLAISTGLYYITQAATYLPIYMTLYKATFIFFLSLIMSLGSAAIAARQLQTLDPAEICFNT